MEVGDDYGGPCSLKCDKKDLLHAIKSTFGGVIWSKIKGEWDMGYKNVILSRWGKGTKRAKISRNIELSKMGEGGKGGRNLEVQFSATVHHLVDDRALEESLPNIVTNNLRRDLGDSNMVSSPLIEGISTKLGDYFESTVADVRMDFEIREG
ncbi:hypothetical protein GOBAR_AA39095 [Gossypium barbadense]|uniref:Uncharacterized protein n=1 Tax=Gossypium barbadense TaxID=3634 RepID=A0A2P5VRZ1_GOSBA|nr:hypothetical protein GOBAR_AA39095 [Gossypium barbadense]